jgi:hypothetical protein
MRDYQIASPSLEGVLNHDSLLYDGVKRPIELLRVLDGPASKGMDKLRPAKQDHKCTEDERKILEDYFHDLYGIFMNKLSFFVVRSASDSDETVKLQAMLQEMIKVKRLMGR